jgi:hypothetical protein
MSNADSTKKTGLEILDRLLLGHTAYHRRPDAWDLLDSQGRVVAVLCPRQHHVSVAPTDARPTPHRGENIVPYKEKVAAKITGDKVDEGIALVAELLRPEAGQRALR